METDRTPDTADVETVNRLNASDVKPVFAARAGNVYIGKKATREGFCAHEKGNSYLDLATRLHSS